MQGEEDYVYTGHGRYPYQHIPRTFLKQMEEQE